MAPSRASIDAYQSVLASIEHGHYPHGSRLPSERSLAQQLGVSRATVRTALIRLADEGVLAASAQSGWYSTARPLGEPPSTLQSFSEMARARGLRPTSHVLSVRARSASLGESARLQIAPASEVLEIRRVRGMDQTLVCLDQTVLAMPLAKPLLELDLENASLYEFLREYCHVEIHRSSYTVKAEAATEELASLLRIRPASPVLVGRETTYTADGRAVNLGTARYRGDAYEFQADLYRPLS